MLREMKSLAAGLMLPVDMLLQHFVVRDDEFYALMISLIGSGPLDGGCYLLAKALQNIYGGSLWGILSRRPTVGIFVIDHVLLKKGSSFYDGDGVHKSSRAVLDSYEDAEDFWGESRLVKIDGSTREIDLAEIPTDPGLVALVEAYLREKANAPTSR